MVKVEKTMKTKTKMTAMLLSVMLGASSLLSCSSAAYTENNTEYFIGSTGPLTGDASAYGQSVKNGAELAIADINANGGLNGVTFHFEMIDDAAAADKAATGYTTLYEKGMQISIGSVTSGSCASFAATSAENKMLFMTPSASADDVISSSDYGFRVCFGDPQQGTIAADTLGVDYSKIGVIYDTSDTYSAGIYEAFEAEMTVLGKSSGTDYVVYTFNKENNKDFSTQIDGLAAENCDVIFLPIYYTEAGLIAKRAASAGYNVPIFGCDGLDGIVDQLDNSVTAQIQYITPFDVHSTDPEVVEFVDKYVAKYGESPDQFAADGYDAIMIIYSAMKEAGVSDVKIAPDALADIIKPILTGGTFTYSGITGKNMTWTDAGSCNKQANIVTVVR